jgi:heme A synthase
MSRVAIILALSAAVASGCPAPGLFLAIGLGIAAIGTGWVSYRRARDPGFSRLAGAAAITVGAVGGLLGGLRVALALAAIDHLDRILG